MDVTPLIDKDLNIINGYSSNSFIVNQVKYESSIIVGPRSIEAWEIKDAASISLDHLIMIASKIHNYPDQTILLLGVGRKHLILSELLSNASPVLIERNITIDVMSSVAACRTYNILLSESRNVVAALLLG